MGERDRGNPGEILKLIYSVDLLRAAFRIRKAALNGPIGAEARFLRVKRLFDVAFSSVVLFLYVPVFLAIAAAIKLDSPGPVFYTSERIGKKGVVFRCIKFRTMARDAGGCRDEIARMNQRDDMPFEASNCPRFTRLGRFLRKYSLDELPQFINVLRGEMSIIGPRPPLAHEVCKYDLDHLCKFGVAPGITGVWQAPGQDPPFASDVSQHVDYVENWGFWLDLKILLRTLMVVFLGADSNRGRGAGGADGPEDER